MMHLTSGPVVIGINQYFDMILKRQTLRKNAEVRTATRSEAWHLYSSPKSHLQIHKDGNSMKFDLTSCGITTLVAILATMWFDDSSSEFNSSSCSYPSRWTQVQSSDLNSHRWIHFEFQFKADTRARIRDFCWSRWTSYRTTVPLMSCGFPFVHVISPT